MFDMIDIIRVAMALGIKLTNADVGSYLCQCWIDRVLLAAMHADRGEMAACQAAIDSANAYAV